VAINQVSLSFYPPRWKRRLTPHPLAKTDQGTPVEIEDAVRVEEDRGPAIAADDFKQWLIQRGFKPVDWGGGMEFERGQVRSVVGVEKEIDVGFSGCEYRAYHIGAVWRPILHMQARRTLKGTHHGRRGKDGDRDGRFARHRRRHCQSVS
jgi:hypothetical protein